MGNQQAVTIGAMMMRTLHEDDLYTTTKGCAAEDVVGEDAWRKWPRGDQATKKCVDVAGNVKITGSVEGRFFGSPCVVLFGARIRGFQ